MNIVITYSQQIAIVSLLSGAILSALIGWWIHHSRCREKDLDYNAKEHKLNQKIVELEEECQLKDGAIEMRDEQIEKERINRASLQARCERIPELIERIKEQENTIRKLTQKQMELESDLTAQRVKAQEERYAYNKSLEILKQSRDDIKLQFNRLANSVFQEQSQRFRTQSSESIKEILEPLKQQVEQFRRRVDEVHNQESKDMASLRSQIDTLRTLNQAIEQEAKNLTNALKGDSKSRGIWGEMVLQRVLEVSGLKEGIEYEKEISIEIESKRYRVDIVIHLPNGRDIIIDSKTNLIDYEKYINSTDSTQASLHLANHIKALKTQIDSLSAKRYFSAFKSIDAVMLFVPIEGALSSAIAKDTTLYEYAYNKKIILVSPSSLLPALKSIESSWKIERQNKNAMVIAQKAGAMYDKFALFVEDMTKIGKQITTLQKSYDNAYSKLTSGRGNLIDRVEELKELGVNSTKDIPTTL